jgi:amino acid transporter/nucleotide-binding universal stress UspA family protein
MVDSTEAGTGTGTGTGTTRSPETHHEGGEEELSRDMGLFSVTFIGIGAMIGAGVFALTGFAAGLAGPALLVAFLLNGAIASLTAMSYAELGAAFPRSGGAYNWVSEALPRPWGFYTGWANWFAQAVACALYAVTFGSFFVVFVDILVFGSESGVLLGIPHDIWEKALAAVVVALFAYVNYRGAEETGKAGIVITTAKVIILGVFVVFGAAATVEQPDWPSVFFGGQGFFATGVVGVLAAMGFTYVAFEGYDIIVQSGEEVIDPGRNIPKAIFYSILVVVPIYVFVAFAALGGIQVTADILALAGMSGESGIATWQVLGGLGELGIIQAAGQFVPYGLPLLLIAGLTATMSALNATLYASSRIAFSMSRDKLLPDPLSRVHVRTRAPHLAIAVSAAVIGLMAVSLPIESVAAASSVMFILLFSMVNVAVIAMRRARPDLERPFSVPFMPVTPALAIALQLLLAPFLLVALGLTPGLGQGSEGFVALVAMGAWFALGFAVYYAYVEDRELERMEAETPQVVTQRTTSGKATQLVVPLANPTHGRQLVRTAIDVARGRDAELLVMSVVTVPQQTPLEEGRQFVDSQWTIVDEAISYIEEAAPDIPVTGTVRIGHDVAQAVLNTVEQNESDAVLIGWRGRSRRTEFVLGSNIDRIVTRARCDVLVERVGTSFDTAVESILVPVAGGPHASLAAEVAGAIARPNDATVHVVNVVPPAAGEERRAVGQALLDGIRETLPGVTVETTLIEAEDVARALVAAADAHDITVIGATRESLLQQLVFGSIPEDVAARAAGTVIMTKRHLGLTSWLSRWFVRD